jgi:hypothetical protein
MLNKQEKPSTLIGGGFSCCTITAHNFLCWF